MVENADLHKPVLNKIKTTNEPRHWNWNWKWNWNWNSNYRRHYFQSHMTYGSQTKQGGDLGWEDPTDNVTWLFDVVVKWQIKNVITPLSQALWIPNLAGWWVRIRGPHPQSHVTLRYYGHVGNKRRYISSFTRSMDPKLSRMVT